MVTTNSEEYFRKLTLFRNNCIGRENSSAPWYYEVVDFSNNFNFTEFQAALGSSQLKRIEAFISKRRALMKAYREKLKHLAHVQLFTPDYDEHTAFHLCVVQIDYKAYAITRQELMTKLKERGIGTQVHYIPLYRHPCFKKMGDISSYFPQMESYYEKALSLPLYFDLTMEEVDRVVQALSDSLK